MDEHMKGLLLVAMEHACGVDSQFESLVILVKDLLEKDPVAESLQEVVLKIFDHLLENKWIDVLIVDLSSEPVLSVLDLSPKEALAWVEARWKEIDYGVPGYLDVCWYILTDAGELAYTRLKDELPVLRKPSGRKRKR